MLFLTVFFTIPLKIENVRLKLTLAIPTGAPITVANRNAIEMLPVVTDKTINDLKQLKEAIYLLSK